MTKGTLMGSSYANHFSLNLCFPLSAVSIYMISYGTNQISGVDLSGIGSKFHKCGKHVAFGAAHCF